MTLTRETHLYAQPDLALDIWRPAGPAHGAVVYAHGGGFIHGSRDDRLAAYYGPRLAQTGLAFASISYRKGKVAPTDFDAQTHKQIADAAAKSADFYPDIEARLFGAALYRGVENYTDAVRFIFAHPEFGLSCCPWVAMGMSAGGLCAIGMAHGMQDGLRASDLPPPKRIIAIASVIPQPWMIAHDRPPISLLTARGDKVFPKEAVDRLQDYVVAHDLHVSFNRIPYGWHNRPLRELLPKEDGETGPWSTWLLAQINGALPAPERS